MKFVRALPVAILLCLPATALAQDFVRTQTCNTAGAINACEPGEVPKPIAWPNACVTFYVNETGTTDIPNPEEPGKISNETLDAVRLGFLEWNSPDDSKFKYVFGGQTNEDRAEWVPSRGKENNANIVVWRDAWPSDFSQTAYAITSVNYNPESAEILDADIELNGEFHQFTISDSDPVVDVQNTIAHESGHFLGLDHSPDRLATMYGSAPIGQVSKRDLAEGDIEGVSAVYPDDGTTDVCAPSDGFFEKPAAADEGCCSTVDTGRRATTPLVFAALVLGLAVARRRRN